MTSFPSTNWSLVERAGHGQLDARRQAQGELLRPYLPAILRHLVRHKGIPADRAEDILQSFMVAKVLSGEVISQADRTKGKFRSLILTVLDHHVSDCRRHDSRLKRSTARESALNEAAAAVAASAMPDESFDMAWARQVIESAIALTQEECRQKNRLDVWNVFDARVLSPLLRGEEPTPYAPMVERLGISSPAEACNLLVTGKRMFARALRAVVGEYSKDDAEIEEELLDLRKILADAGARSGTARRT